MSDFHDKVLKLAIQCGCPPKGLSSEWLVKQVQRAVGVDADETTLIDAIKAAKLSRNDQFHPDAKSESLRTMTATEKLDHANVQIEAAQTAPVPSQISQSRMRWLKGLSPAQRVSVANGGLSPSAEILREEAAELKIKDSSNE